MNPLEPNVFERLKDETQELVRNSKQLGEAFDNLVALNGTGDPIRKRFKTRLKKSGILSKLKAQ
jgi:hypothetical protein